MGFRTRGTRDQVLKYSKHLGLEFTEEAGYYYFSKKGEHIGTAFGNASAVELLVLYKRRMEGMKIST